MEGLVRIFFNCLRFRFPRLSEVLVFFATSPLWAATSSNSSQDLEGSWRRRVFVRLPVSGRNQWCQSRVLAFSTLLGRGVNDDFFRGSLP